MKPIIGITAGYDDEKKRLTIGKNYYNAVIEAGGIPYIIPVTTKLGIIEDILILLDGVILSGGEDIDPIYFNENPLPGTGSISPARDIQEVFIAETALKRNMPVFGICRGIQIMNVAAGGTIYQDIYSQINGRELFKHSQDAPKWYGTHKVKIFENSKLLGIVGKGAIIVNSFHHQAVRDVAPDFEVAAITDDGIIEAIEHTQKEFAVGVQWHPELMWKNDRSFLGVFNALVESAIRYNKRKSGTIESI